MPENNNNTPFIERRLTNSTPVIERRLTNAKLKLEALGYTLEDVSSFIEEHIENTEFIYKTCLDYGFNTDDIAVIMDIEDYKGSVISAFFFKFGVDPTALEDQDDFKVVRNVDDELSYKGSIKSDFFGFIGTFESTVSGDKISGVWSIKELNISGTLLGSIDNEDGSFILEDESFNISITGSIVDDHSVGVWTSGIFSGDVDATLLTA